MSYSPFSRKSFFPEKKPSSDEVFGAVPSRFGSPTPLDGPLEGHLGQRIRRMELALSILSGSVSVILSRSALYFSPGNMDVLGGATDPIALIGETESAARSLQLNIDMTATNEAYLRRLNACLSELRCAAGAARTASQLFYLLHEAGLRPSARVPLRKSADAVSQLLLATGAAITRGEAPVARAVACQHRGVSILCNEMDSRVRDLALYVGMDFAAMMHASLIALSVVAEQTARIAYAFALSAEEGANFLTRISYAEALRRLPADIPPPLR